MNFVFAGAGTHERVVASYLFESSTKKPIYIRDRLQSKYQMLEKQSSSVLAFTYAPPGNQLLLCVVSAVK